MITGSFYLLRIHDSRDSIPRIWRPRDRDRDVVSIRAGQKYTPLRYWDNRRLSKSEITRNSVVFDNNNCLVDGDGDLSR